MFDSRRPLSNVKSHKNRTKEEYKTEDYKNEII
jgi:hypothetical protein